MATMVLTTLGRAVAGPVGAALGGLAGRSIDGAVFGSGAREGPRLRELQVQVSSYGAAIPKLFGTMRVAGTVIWATDLRESAATTGGKGAGRTTRYSYSASFAVAVSARRIAGIGRIWAEGKLLRGAAGDWKTRTGGFRWYPGDEAQEADPLIASIVGIGDAPAHRGIAYVVFEDLALADFGNRLPSLTFEVMADAGAPVTVGTIVTGLGGGAIRAEAAGPVLTGYAASGERVRDAVDALVMPLGGWYAPDGDGTLVRLGEGAARLLPTATLPTDVPEWHRPPAVPADVAVAHHDPARDYQAGVQQVLRPGGAARMLRIELPAAIDAATAAGIAGDAAARAALAGEVRVVTLDWRAIDLSPGDRVMLSEVAGAWRVRRTRIEAMRITVELVRIATATQPVTAATGAAQLAADVVVGTTRLLLVELPPPPDAPDARPWIAAVAAGTRPGWRRAMLLTGDDIGGWREIGETAAPGVIGTVAVPPAPASPLIEDRASVVEVTLLHDAMTLDTIDAAAMERGGNAAMIGAEIVQFAAAQRIGPARWRLTRLWRGRHGSEAAMPGHAVGEVFALLDPATFRRLDDPGLAVGQPVTAMAVGVADADVATATIVPDGRALVPPAPVHLSAKVAGDVLVIDWVRRVRGASPWRDGIDVPLGEEREAYRVTVIGDGGDPQTVEVAEPRLAIPAPVAPVTIAVRQIGTHGPSPAALLSHRPEDAR